MPSLLGAKSPGNANALERIGQLPNMDVLSIARDALDLGPICDACLGRCVADRSRGLTNHDRGNALRVVVSMVDDEPLEVVGEPCWVCEGLTDRYDALAEQAVEAIGDIEFRTYQVGTRVSRFVEENDILLREEIRGDADAGEPIKSEVNREVGKRLGAMTDTRVEFGRPDVLVLLDMEADEIDVTVNSAFVYGRYRKLERGIPQTRWPCYECDGSGQSNGETCPGCDGSGYRYDRSVEQLIAPVIQEAMGGESATFHGAGREDVDARMLGRGRPFVVEVDEPRRRMVDTSELVDRIAEYADGAVEVNELALANYQMVEHVKELDASKTYEAHVSFDRPVGRPALIDAIERLAGTTIKQQTPTRVSHRRADLLRERTVHEIDLVEATETHAIISVHGEGGLYIKELMHGDEGRTDPSLAGLLGIGVTVDALDVVSVEADGEQAFDDDELLVGN